MDIILIPGRWLDGSSWDTVVPPPVRKLAKIRDVEYVDLPTGHWPQFTRPGDLARAIA